MHDTLGADGHPHAIPGVSVGVVQESRLVLLISFRRALSRAAATLSAFPAP